VHDDLGTVLANQYLIQPLRAKGVGPDAGDLDQEIINLNDIESYNTWTDDGGAGDGGAGPGTPREGHGT